MDTWDRVDSHEVLPVSTTGQQESGSPRRGFRFGADKTFETTIMHTLLAGGLADVWQVSSVGHLVALAGQACKEVSMASDATPMQPDSRFTERLRSTQVFILLRKALVWASMYKCVRLCVAFIELILKDMCLIELELNRYVKLQL